MPDKDTKKNQQENTTPAVSATKDIQQQRKEALDKAIGQVTFNPDSTNIESMEKAAIARQNLTDDQKRSLGVENAIHNTYSSPIREMSDTISDWEKAKNAAKKQDEVAQRRSAAFQMAAGISDSLAALGNLIGVSYGGSHIDMGTGSLTPLAQKLEAARLERKADIKSIDDRLDQYRNQLLQMQLAKGTALAQAKERASEAAREQARFDIEMAFKQGRAKVADSQWQQTFDANQGNAPATLEEKLAAIGAAARTDKTIQDELRKLAGTYKPEQKDEEETQVSEIDGSHLNGLGTMSMNPYFGQSKASKINWNQFE